MVQFIQEKEDRNVLWKALLNLCKHMIVHVLSKMIHKMAASVFMWKKIGTQCVVASPGVDIKTCASYFWMDYYELHKSSECASASMCMRFSVMVCLSHQIEYLYIFCFI